jgi:hypothetical protein
MTYRQRIFVMADGCHAMRNVRDFIIASIR